MNLKGVLVVKKDTKSYGENGFTKREFVIETEEKYSQKILIELIKDKCALLDNFKIGDKLDVSVNILGREWINPQGEAKYFNSIQGWRIENLTESATSTPQQLPPVEDNFPRDIGDPDDLPF